jgi:hypothetical protein
MAIAYSLPPRAVQAPQLGREQEGDDRPGGGITIHNQVLELWLPQKLVDLAKREPGSVVVQTHPELQRILERQQDQEMVYAITIRAHQANGGAANITFLRCPYRERETLSEFRDIMATAAGSPPRTPMTDYSCTKILVMHSAMTRVELFEAIQASSAPGKSRAPE